MRFKIQDSRFKTRKGSTLLLALLILSTVLIIAVSVAEVARTELLIGRATDYTSVATYAAESALEEGAYQIRKNNSTVAALNGTVLTLGNTASYTRTSDTKTGALAVAVLQKDMAAGFDFYDADLGVAAGKESVKVTIANCAGSEVLELGFTEWDPGTGSFNSNFQKFRYTCSGSNVTITNNSVTAARTYRLYVRALTANMANIRVWGCSQDNGAGTCDMPGRVNLSATASFRGAQRILSLDMPRLPPVSGIYSYTLFSECQIIKDVTIPSPAC